MKAQQLAAELEVEMMADMYNRYEAYGALCKCVTACFCQINVLTSSSSDIRDLWTCVVGL